MLNTLKLGMRLRCAGQSFYLTGLIFLGIFVLGWGAVQGSYEAMAQREFARSPEFATSSLEQEKTENQVKLENSPLRLVWIASSGAELAHGYLLFPKTENAPKPPGMNKWLPPGQAQLSPELAKRYPTGKPSPWGEVAGIIPTNVLSNPNELFFYARPTGPLPKQWGTAVTAFPGASLPVNGDQINLLPQIYVKLFLTVFLASPGIILILIGLFQGFRLRETSLLMREIGASRRQRFIFGVGANLKPILGSLLIVTIIIAFIASKSVTIPSLNTTILPEDISEQLSLIITLISLIWIVAPILSGINGLIAVKRKSEKTLQKILTRISQIMVIPTLILVWIFTSFESLSGLTLYLVFLGSVISLGLAIPTISIWIAEIVGICAHKITIRGSGIIVRRKLTAHSSTLMVCLLGMSFTLTTLGATQLYSLKLSGPMYKALAENEILNNTVLKIDTAGLSVTEINGLRDELKNYGGTIAVTLPKGGSNENYAQVDQQVTEILNLPKNETITANASTLTPKAALIIGNLGGKVKLGEKLPPTAKTESIYLISDKPLDTLKISSICSNRGLKAYNIGENWLGGAKLLADKINWFTIFGIPAALALICGSIATTYQHASKRLKLKETSQVLSLSKWETMRIVSLTVFNPALLCVVLSQFGYVALTIGFAKHSYGFVNTSTGFQISLFVVGALTALYLTGMIYKETLNKN